MNAGEGCLANCRHENKSRDRADVEQVFNKYLQSLNNGDVALASQVWLQSLDLLVVTPVGRLQGWASVQHDIYANTVKTFPERNVQASNVSIVVAGDAAWVVYDFVFTAKLADGKQFISQGLGEPWVSAHRQRLAHRPSALFSSTATLMM